MKRKNRICLLLCTALLLVQFSSAVYASGAISEGVAQDTAAEMLADPELAEKGSCTIRVFAKNGRSKDVKIVVK